MKGLTTFLKKQLGSSASNTPSASGPPSPSADVSLQPPPSPRDNSHLQNNAEEKLKETDTVRTHYNIYFSIIIL